MKQFLGKLVYTLGGWKLINKLDLSKIDKCVLVCAPHTSNWDFYYTVSAFWQMNIPFKMFIKDAWTKPWYGYFIKKMGGIGIDRSQRNNMVDFAAEVLKSNESLYLLNTPEGTRSFSEKWKNGFYYISKKADVPILLAYCDYKNKEAGIEKVIETKGRSLEDVMQEIEDYYKNVTAKYPELYNKKNILILNASAFFLFIADSHYLKINAIPAFGLIFFIFPYKLRIPPLSELKSGYANKKLKNIRFKNLSPYL